MDVNATVRQHDKGWEQGARDFHDPEGAFIDRDKLLGCGTYLRADILGVTPSMHAASGGTG